MGKTKSFSLICLLLGCLTLSVYLPMLGHGFVDYDDQIYLFQNAHVKPGLTLEGVKWAFAAGYANNWHPVTWLSHMADYQLYGANPRGHHLTSLLLHILAALLLFSLLNRMTGAIWRSAFVAALFALHPLHVESVAWASERKDVLSGLFWMLTMLAYVRYVERPGGKRYALVAASYALGLMAKPMLVTLPFVLLLMDYWPLHRLTTKPAPSPLAGEGWGEGAGSGAASAATMNHEPSTINRLFLEKTPLIAMAAASCVITYLVQQGSGAMSTVENLSLPVRLANACVAYTSYIGKMLWPANLAVIYPHPRESLSALQALGSLVFLLGASLVALRARRGRPYVTVGWLWYIGTLIPVIGLVQVGEQAMADRYTYLPLIGLFIILAWGAYELVPNGRKLLPAAAAVVLVILGGLTVMQVGYWRDSKTLFQHALEVTSGNFVAHNGVAYAYEREGDMDLALAHYRTAAHISPGCIPIQRHLSDLLMSAGEVEEAVEHYGILTEVDPKDAQARYSLGLALQKLGKLDEAADKYREAVRLRPRYVKALGSLGNVLFLQGKTGEAIQKYREILEIDPDDPVARRNLAAVEARQNGGDGAVGQSEAENNEGMRLAGEGRYAEAAEHYVLAVRLDPRNANAYCNYGVALAAQSQLGHAIVQYRKALKINPRHAESHLNLAAALATQGKLDEAISHFRGAIRLKPEQADAHGNLAIALFYKKDYAVAWKEVHLCRHYDGNPSPAFVQDLSTKMPDPGE